MTSNKLFHTIKKYNYWVYGNTKMSFWDFNKLSDSIGTATYMSTVSSIYTYANTIVLKCNHRMYAFYF